MEGPASLLLPCSPLLPATQLTPSRGPLPLPSPTRATCLSAWCDPPKPTFPKQPRDSLLMLSVSTVQASKPWGPATEPQGSAEVPRALQRPFGHRRRTRPFHKTTKEPAGRLDTQPVATGYRIPPGSTRRASQSIPASGAGGHSPLHPVAAASSPPRKSGRV